MEIQCNNWNKTFIKDRKERKFCSRSCGISVNNRLYPKVKYTHFCKLCKCRVSQRAKICKPCFKKVYYDKLVEEHGEKKLKEVRLTHLGTAYQWNSIRDWAKRLMVVWQVPKICSKCQWSYHVEVSHKKSISSFSLEARVKEVNSSENLEYLCPNCHWLFENNVSVTQSGQSVRLSIWEPRVQISSGTHKRN